ncbi:MAG: phage integrase N-terminal SAM-like domain-containing protein [Marinobacter sp.]|uniref:phage integrase N-terminal SAM-like domain-containing protein n=1 Tax=Marinobacter sp. TaxID=50741 RepID=UPI0034A0041C
MDDIPTRLPPTPIRFMDRFRAFIRTRHLAYRTEKTYCLWVRDFILFHSKKHPESMGSAEVNQWLSYLANKRNVAINTQKTALNAIVFLYHQFLGRELGNLQFTKTSKGRKLPTVFSHEEAMLVLSYMEGAHHLAGSLLYGAGLRVMEAVRLRIQDVDFSEACLSIRETKGDKWRRTFLPASVCGVLKAQVELALSLHRQDLLDGHRSSIGRLT